VLADLRSRLPNIPDPTKLTDEQANLLAFAASLYVELGDLEGAEKIYRQLTQRNPDQVYALANFLGTYRDVGKCFELLEQSYQADKVQDILTVGVNVSRARRDDVGDKFDPQMEDWLARALRENPDSISLQMLQADFYDVQKRYEDAIGIYDKLLDRQDLIGFRRAIVLNNLAFLAALAGSAGGSNVDALKLAEEAESILGPSADILDTKAVVLIALKRYSEAIELLKLSLTDNPTGAKYFHLVTAHLGAGENAAAIDAWEKAEAAGLTKDELNRLEHARYDEVKAKIDQLRKGSSAVTQNDSLRNAG
jgi:cellulose synthase operon protein C